MADMSPLEETCVRAWNNHMQEMARVFARAYDEWIDQERAREAFVNDGGDPEFIERMEEELGVTHEP